MATMPKVKKLSYNQSGACPTSSTSLPGVVERLRAFLEKEGWPEEYGVEFLLEHYALLDWIAVQLFFYRPQKLTHLWARRTGCSYTQCFAKSATNQEDLLVIKNFELKRYLRKRTLPSSWSGGILPGLRSSKKSPCNPACPIPYQKQCGSPDQCKPESFVYLYEIQLSTWARSAW